MTLSPRVVAARALFKQHLDRCDWSGLTPGRSRILDVFLKLATIEGYSAVTMRALARQANVKAATIYFHFPGGRSEIVAQSLRWHYTNWGYAILEAIDQSTSAEEFWDALVGSAAKQQVSIPASDLWDLLVRMDRAGGFLEPEFRHEIDHWLDLCCNLFQAGAEALGFVATRRKIRAVMSMLDASTTWSDWSGDPASLDDVCSEAIGLSRVILSAWPVEDSVDGGKQRRNATDG